MDVGTGTGILSFFALQAGAKVVYAIDASDSINIAQKIAKVISRMYLVGFSLLWIISLIYANKRQMDLMKAV